MQKSSTFGFSRPIPEPDIPPLVFFDTNRQQTRLAVIDGRPWIELEEKATGEVKSYPVEGTGVTVSPDHSERAGLVSIGERKNWYYSKRLFLDADDLTTQIALRVDHG